MPLQPRVPRAAPGRRRTADLSGRIDGWEALMSVAEFLGFAVPATVGAVTAGEPARVAVPALLLAGAVEGALLGTGQALVLTGWALVRLPAERERPVPAGPPALHERCG